MDGELALLLSRARDEGRPLRLSAARLRDLMTSDVHARGRVWERARTLDRCPHGAPTGRDVDGHGCRACDAVAGPPALASIMRDAALRDLDCLYDRVRYLADEAAYVAEDAARVARVAETAAMDLRQQAAALRALFAPVGVALPAFAPGVAVTTVAAGVATTASAETEAPDGD